MLPREQINKIAQRVLKKKRMTEAEFLTKYAPKLCRNVAKNGNLFWREYGPYVWNLLVVLKKYALKEFRQMEDASGGGGSFGKDEEMRARYDYGSDMNNWAAACEYLMDRAHRGELGQVFPHHVETDNGDTRQYAPNVGFIDEQEEQD